MIRTRAWTEVNSWFVVMGGFAFEDTAPDDHQLVPRDRQRFVLACSNLLKLRQAARGAYYASRAAMMRSAQIAARTAVMEIPRVASPFAFQ